MKKVYTKDIIPEVHKATGVSEKVIKAVLKSFLLSVVRHLDKGHAVSLRGYCYVHPYVVKAHTAGVFSYNKHIRYAIRISKSKRRTTVVKAVKPFRNYILEKKEK